MTQSSRPQAGNKDPIYGNAAFVDAGPWSRDEWAKKLIIEWVGDAVTTRGPFAKYLNRLAVTNPAGVTISVDTGAGYCGGSLLDNTAAVAFTPNTPGIAARTDKVVLVENNTNVAYTGAASGVILDFPTVLTDYSGAASVPPYACRLAILRGDAATGNPTALIQSADYWMIELYRFTISNVPAISALTDNRDYVDAEMKSLFIPAISGYNTTDGTNITHQKFTAFGGSGPDFAGINLPDNKIASGYGNIIVPVDLINNANVEALVYPTASADIYSIDRFDVALIDAAGGFGTTSPLAAESVTQNIPNAVAITTTLPIALTAAYAGYLLTVEYERQATNVLDTLNSDVLLFGWRLTYLGYR